MTRIAVKASLVLVTALAAGFFFLSRDEEPNPSEEPLDNVPAARNPVTHSPRAARSNPDVLEQPAAAPSLEAKAASVEEIIKKLQEFAYEDDVRFLEAILSEMTHANREVRRAALEATIQFGSREAIPRLREMVVEIEDPREQVEILDAIEFLELPSWREIKEQMPKKSGRLPVNP